MPDEQKIPEGNLSLRFDLPASLKTKYEKGCRLEGKTMTEVTIQLIKNWLEYSY